MDDRRDRLKAMRKEVFGSSVVSRPEVQEWNRRENERYRAMLDRVHTKGPMLTAGMECQPESAAGNIADSLVEQRDLLVMEAIDYAMGRDDWTPEGVRKRGLFQEWPDGRTEFAFDGQPLLTFYPPEFDTERDDATGQVTVKGIQRYRRHYETDQE